MLKLLCSIPSAVANFSSPYKYLCLNSLVFNFMSDFSFSKTNHKKAERIKIVQTFMRNVF